MRKILNESDYTFTPFQKLTLLFIFLAAGNFFNKFYYFIFLAFLVYILLERAIIRVNISFVSLLVLSFCICVFAEIFSSKYTSLFKPLTYPICYFIGYNIIFNSRIKRNNISKDRNFEIIVILLASANLLHLLLNWIININSTVRNTVDFWTGEVLSSTGQMSISCLIIGSACAILFIKNKLIYKFISVIALAIVLGYNLILAGRTVIILTFIMVLISFIYLSFKEKDNKYKLLVLLFIIFLILIVCICFYFNFFNVRTSFMESNLYNRFYGDFGDELGSGGRFKLKLQFLPYLLSYPFGGEHIREIVGKYAHDLYLDTYDYAGIIAFIAIVIYIIYSIINLIRVLKSNYISVSVKHLALCVYFVLYIEFMIEPILLGMPWLFATFCFMDGALTCLLELKGDL